jgi:cytochrome c biogenesis protein CcmG/thiol:disulfide interchange protein DsbE
MELMPVRRISVGLAALAVILTACSSGREPVGPADHRPIPATNATSAPLLPVDAAELPSFDLASYQQLLTQLKGTPVLVNVWASWCGPCKDEAPRLAQAVKTYGDRVQFIGIDILDARDSARQFMTTYGWTYPSLYDATGAIRDGLGIIGQPGTIFYDGNGTQVAQWSGALPEDELMKRLEQIVA